MQHSPRTDHRQAQTPGPANLTLAGDDRVTPDLYRRVLRYVQIPDWRPTGGRPVKGTTVKAIARELAEYADWKTGAGAYPSIAALAVGAQVNYRTAAAAVAALVHYRLIALTRDNGGRHVPNEYRLLNPMLCGLTVLNPDRFRAAAEEVQDKVKGKPAAKPPEPAPLDTVSRAAAHGVTQTLHTVSQPPPQGPPSTTTTDHVGMVTPDRAHAREDEPPIEAAAAPTARRRRRVQPISVGHARAIQRARGEPRDPPLAGSVGPRGHTPAPA